MEHVHSIILIEKNNKFLNYYDKRWNTYLFPNLKGNNIEEIKEKYNTDEVEYLFDKVHEKYSIPHKEMRIYHHYFYKINKEIEGEYFSLDELLNNNDINKINGDIINIIKECYK